MVFYLKCKCRGKDKENRGIGKVKYDSIEDTLGDNSEINPMIQD